MSGVAPWHQAHWDWRAAGNFIGGGSGTGLLIAAVLSTLSGASLTAPVLVALALIGAGLFCVLLEIGRPWRSIHVLFNPNTSWMSREAIVAGPLFLFGLLAAWFNSPWIGLLAALIAVAYLFCQGRILHAAKGIPAWRHPRIVPLMMLSGVTEGCGLYLLLALLSGAPMVPVALLMLVLIVARLLAWNAYHRALQGHAPLAALRALGEAEGVVIGFGHVAALLLVLTGLYVGAARHELLALAGTAALLGGWWMKFVIVTKAAYNQGYAINHSPSRGASSGGPGDQPGW